LLDALFNNVPCGVGSHTEVKLSHEELDKVMLKGAEWAVENGFGNKEDLQHCESYGKIDGADPAEVSPKAKARGKNQLGTLGAGNHFLEIQFVDNIYDEIVAKTFGFTKRNQIAVMIHCGSRGLGHQVCSDYLRKMEEENPELADSLPERDLIYAPAKSELAKKYFKAMTAAANFAFCNRHIIAHQVREAFKKVFGDKVELNTVYDVAHNIAKIEEHVIDGEKKKVYLHRKGATRAFPAGHPELPEDYKATGQPVLIPGSMGTSSYVLVGTETAMEKSFGSAPHGAGRVMSRTQAKKEFKADEVKQELEKQHIYVKSASLKGISEEAPGVYKDIDQVIKISQESGIGKIIVRVKPLGVIKG